MLKQGVPGGRGSLEMFVAGAGALACAGGVVPLALQGGQVPSGFMQAAAQFHTLRLCGMAPQKLLPVQEHCSAASNSWSLPSRVCSVPNRFPYLVNLIMLS